MSPDIQEQQSSGRQSVKAKNSQRYDNTIYKGKSQKMRDILIKKQERRENAGFPTRMREGWQFDT